MKRQLPLFGLIFVLFHVFFFEYVQAKEVSFEKSKIFFNKELSLEVELAKSARQKSQGLMFREKLAPDAGMLFFYSYPQKLSFWMKNTLIRLSIGFFDENRILTEVVDMDPPLGPMLDGSLKNYVSEAKCKYALEVNRDWFERNKIKVGDRFHWAKP